MSAESGTCYRNSAYRRSLFDHYVQTMSPTHSTDAPEWQGNLLADCMEAQSAAGLNGSLGQLYDPDGTWPQVQGERVAKERQQLAHSQAINIPAIAETANSERSTPIGISPTINVFTAPQFTREVAQPDISTLTSMAVPGETYGLLSEADMHSIVHEAQDRAHVIALQIARDIGWTMPSLISPPEQLFQPAVVEFPLAPVPRMTGS